VAKPDSGIVGLLGDKGGYGWIKGDAGRVLVVWRGGKKGYSGRELAGIGGWRGHKKDGKREGLPWLFLDYEFCRIEETILLPILDIQLKMS